MSYKHGGCGTRLYRIWKAMRGRCNNPNHSEFPRYGCKGIKVCRVWNNFVQFHTWAHYNGYQNNLSIDRIDGSKNYCPNNCRWSDAKTQARNRKDPLGKSNLRGVYCDKRHNKWQSMWWNPITRKLEHVGMFDTAQQASKARTSYIKRQTK